MNKHAAKSPSAAARKAKQRGRSRSAAVRRAEAIRRRARYSRDEWVHKLIEILVRAGHAFNMARLASLHAQPAIAAQWMIECRTTLQHGNFSLLSEVKRRFDRKKAFQNAVDEFINSSAVHGRRVADGIAYRAYGGPPRGLAAKDTNDFAVLATKELDLVTTLDCSPAKKV